MAHRITSKKKALFLSSALFLIAFAVLVVTKFWWPGIMLAVGLPFALRQYLLGRTYDMCISLFVFVGTYVTVQFDINWQVFLPILFSIGAVYVVCREFTAPYEEEDEVEKDEDIQHEIEEEKKK